MSAAVAAAADCPIPTPTRTPTPKPVCATASDPQVGQVQIGYDYRGSTVYGTVVTTVYYLPMSLLPMDFWEEHTFTERSCSSGMLYQASDKIRITTTTTTVTSKDTIANEGSCQTIRRLDCVDRNAQIIYFISADKTTTCTFTHNHTITINSIPSNQDPTTTTVTVCYDDICTSSSCSY
jgi:hypothetical protein